MALYLVTGGAGFIGSNLVDKLIADGHRVRVIDDLTTGKRENLNPGAEFFELDFTDLDAIRPVFEGVNGVFHFGARPSVPFSVANPVESTKINVVGTLHVLVAARDAGVKRVIYSASSSAYGTHEPPHHPDMHPLPLSPYALQKHVGEQFSRQFAELYGLETVCLRYFNVYGPRMNDVGAYVPVHTFFARQKKEGKPLTVFGDGEQYRDFTHVSDVVRANIAAMHSPKVGKGEVLNVACGERTTLNRVAEIFGGPREYHPLRPGEIKNSQADISRTKELLDWEPQIKFEDGLRAWLRSIGLEPAE